MSFLLALVVAADISSAPLFVEALERYRQLDFELALEKLELLRASDSNLASSDLAVVHVWRGIVLSQLGKPDAADAALRNAVETDATVVAPTDAPPSVIASLERAREAMRAADGADPNLDDPQDPKGPIGTEDLDPGLGTAEPVGPAMNPMFLTGVGLAGGGGLLALSSAVGLVVVDAQIGAPGPFEERQGLGTVGAVLLGTTITGLALAGAGAAVLVSEL